MKQIVFVLVFFGFISLAVGQGSEKMKVIDKKVVLIDGTKTYVTTDNGLTWKMYDPRLSSVTKDLSKEFNHQVYIDKNGKRCVTYDRGLTWIDEGNSSVQNNGTMKLDISTFEILTISTSANETELFSLQIFDLLGNQVLSEQGLTASNRVPYTKDISNLKSGVYACRVQSGSGLYTKIINISVK